MPEALETGQGCVPRMFAMVGLPAAGKTSRARELASAWSALRLTPDEWMIPLFGQEQPDGKRNVLEGRLIWLVAYTTTRGMTAGAAARPWVGQVGDEGPPMVTHGDPR